ncbi:MAG TPA: hypothetical protein VF556_15825 [Pyrinomonadaceae bacterium]|jgi:hypothetical protein
MSKEEIFRIEDIPKFKKMREQMRGFRIIKNTIPFARPLLRLLGTDLSQLEDAFLDFNKLEKEFEELSKLPDKFNDTFSSRAWIIFNALDLEVVKEALSIATNNIADAEKYLVNYYSTEIVESYLLMMYSVKAFQPRMELAEKALIDYKEERYHACIPVVLALMDGLVNELNTEQNLSFFTENASLNAWDCITANEKGLTALKKILFATRKKTRTETITVPYRNGILHGMDLGYSNKIVAAKTWAVLFAIRDWAIKAERKELQEPPPEPKSTWSDLFNQIQEHIVWKKSFDQSLKEWKPRTISIGTDIPKTGEAEDYPEGTPERKLIEFLTWWKKKNFGYMSSCIWSYLIESDKKMAGRVSQIYDSFPLKRFELLEVIDEAPAITEIRVLVSYEKDGELVENNVKFRLIINEATNGMPLMRDMPNAVWAVVNWGYGVI